MKTFHLTRGAEHVQQPAGDSSKSGKGGLIEAPGTQVFRFKAVGSGGGKSLRLLYQQPFERAGVQAAQKYELMVTIDRPQ